MFATRASLPLLVRIADASSSTPLSSLLSCMVPLTKSTPLGYHRLLGEFRSRFSPDRWNKDRLFGIDDAEDRRVFVILLPRRKMCARGFVIILLLFPRVCIYVTFEKDSLC